MKVWRLNSGRGEAAVIGVVESHGMSREMTSQWDKVD